MRMPTLNKRADVIWVAVALIAGAGGAAYATASGDPPAAPADLRVTAVNDSALAAVDPGDEIAKLVSATGVPASATSTTQTWKVGDYSVLGYTAANGRFCFEFRKLTGGCLGAGVLTDERPLDITTDYGPSAFNVYGLALDGVTAVSVQVDGTSRPAAFAHNAFIFSDGALGGTGGISGTVSATMNDGTTRTEAFHISPVEAQ
jgi:hypothetical protein